MNWLCVSVYTTSFGIDAVCDCLTEQGISGFEIEDENEFSEFLENNRKYWDYVDDELIQAKKGETKVKFYIENDGTAPEKLTEISYALGVLRSNDPDGSLGRLEFDTDGLREEDWANNWKKYFKPIEVGERILIQPEWSPLEGETDRLVFTVNPGMAFGTGTHTSTKLCIREIEKYVGPSTVLLDAGCGSGILSVIALMLGAQSADAVDIDENCIHTAYENADRNNVPRERYNVYAGDITSDKALLGKLRRYDVIVANIVADVIISLLPTVRTVIKEGGVFICSGIIEERLEDVTNAMQEAGINTEHICREDGWASVTCIL